MFDSNQAAHPPEIMHEIIINNANNSIDNAALPKASNKLSARDTVDSKLKPLSFVCQRFKFYWNQRIPICAEVDGVKVDSIIFNKRKLSLLKRVEFGTRGILHVVNTANVMRTPGFAIAVFDADNRLLGVASGGPRIGGIKAGDGEEYDLVFHQVFERLSKADYFYLSIELT